MTTPNTYLKLGIKTSLGNTFLLVFLFLTSISFGQNTYLDNFNVSSYGNNNGSLNWLTGWNENNEGTNPVSGRIQIVSGRLRFQNLDNRSISRTLNFNSALSATLTLDYDRTNGDESLLIQLWNESTGTWNTVATAAGTGSVNYTLTANQISSSSAIQLITGSGNWSSSETIYIDNILFTVDYPDSDGDGINNVVDLDDDNDGILDTDECAGQTSTNDLVLDPGGNVSIYSTGGSGNLVGDANSLCLFDNGIGANYYQFDDFSGDFSSGIGSNLNWTIDVPYYELNWYTSDWEAISEDLRIVSTVGTLTLDIEDGGTYDHIRPPQTTFSNPFDFSIPLTAANFGVSAAVFLDVMQNLTSIQVRGEFWVSETAEESCVVPYGSGLIDTNGVCTLDFDSDSLANSLDVDSDNDGCADAIEAGYTDEDDDGVLGISPVIVDVNGMVTGQGGYGTPADRDNDGVDDFLQVGIAPSITNQPSNANISVGENTSFIVVTSNADTYQWQIYNGSVWVNLTDTGIHGGTTTNTLNITNASISDDENQYRVVVSNTLYICSTETSNSVILTVDVETVITNRKVTYRVSKN